MRRAFAGVPQDNLDPFIHMDQMGEIDWAAGEPKGTPWHPHRGFETVTYIIDGAFEHTHSHGGGGTITNGDTHWMTAGSGILHIEKPPERGRATIDLRDTSVAQFHQAVLDTLGGQKIGARISVGHQVRSTNASFASVRVPYLL